FPFCKPTNTSSQTRVNSAPLSSPSARRSDISTAYLSSTRVKCSQIRRQDAQASSRTFLGVRFFRMKWYSACGSVDVFHSASVMHHPAPYEARLARSRQALDRVAIIDVVRTIQAVLPRDVLGQTERLVDRRGHVLRLLRFGRGVAADLVRGADDAAA